MLLLCLHTYGEGAYYVSPPPHVQEVGHTDFGEDLVGVGVCIGVGVKSTM